MNSNFYGLYKGVRNSAWKFLIDFNVTELPINIFAICDRMDIQVKPYETYLELIKTFGQEERMTNEDGFAMIFDGQWYIFYKSDYRSYARMTFVVLHEIAHILLGHKNRLQNTNSIDFVENKKTKSQLEKEADMFAIRVMSPACILKELNVHTPVEIMEVCHIPFIYAEIRAKRMEILYERNMFYRNALETKVKDQFMSFIKNRRNNRRIEAAEEIGSFDLQKLNIIS